MEKYISKTNIKNFINYLHNECDISGISFSNEVFGVIKSNNSIEIIYKVIGAFLSDMDSNYKHIYYVEDLFDELIKKYDLDFTKSLIKHIQNNKFKEFPNKKRLTYKFRKWAKDVRFLPSRMDIINEFETFYMEFKSKTILIDKELLEEIKCFIIFQGFSSINSIQSAFQLGFTKTLMLLDKLVDEGFLIKEGNIRKYIKV